MNQSREFVLAHLKLARKTLSDHIRELETPTTFDEAGNEVPIYPQGVPKGMSVASVEGIPVDQFRAELVSTAGILVALASGGE